MSREIVEVRRENNVITRREEINSRDFLANNKVVISGVIEDEFDYSHEVLWEKFYKTRVMVERFSGETDFIPIVISQLLIGHDVLKKSFKGKVVEAVGQFRSYNKQNPNGRNSLNVFLFVTAINIYESEDELEETNNANMIYLDGYICKQPNYRKTPLGREICDLFIAVNRPYGKSDYIPCIAWGRNAVWASELEVGKRIELYGRIQSREYFKRLAPDSDTGEYRETYEISIMRIRESNILELEQKD